MHWRKKMFVAQYLAHPELSPAEIAERCGYKGQNLKQRAFVLLRDPEVKEAIQQGQKQILAKLEITAQDVVQDIIDTRQRCVENGDVAWATNLRLKCDELLGKYLGMWTERTEVTFFDGLAERLRKARENVGRVIEGSEEKKPPASLAEPALREEPVAEEVVGPSPEPVVVYEDPVDWVDRLL